MKNSLIVFFFVCAGIVLGTLVSALTYDVKFLKWLSFGLNFGLKNPVTLNLRVLELTLGFNINLNISVIIFVTLAIIIAYQITGKRRRR